MTSAASTTGIAGPDTLRPTGRIGHLDVLRGVALVAMAVYHFAWDLEFFGYIEGGTTGAGGWKMFARAIAGSFLFLAGVSLVLGHTPQLRPRAFLNRFARIAGAALVISVATWFAVPDAFIFFGILHSIAAASLIGLLFLKVPAPVTLLVAALVFLAPDYARAPLFDTPALWWVGLSTVRVLSNDYVPLLPWLAPFLMGMALTRIALRNGWLAPLAGQEPGQVWTKALAFGGRHSLAIYLIHQPVLIALVYVASLVFPAAPADPVEVQRNACVSTCTAEQDQTFCQVYCDCSIGQMVEQGLFSEPASKLTDAEMRERVAGISRQCALETPPGN